MPGGAPPIRPDVNRLVHASSLDPPGRSPVPAMRTPRGPRLPVVGLLSALMVASSSGQAPPRDQEIRTLYLAHRDLTQVTLTLALWSPGGEPLPVTLTITGSFPGRRQTGPVTQVRIHASAGLLWAPKPQLTFVVDGVAVDLSPTPIVDAEATLHGVDAMVSTDLLTRIGQARSVTGNALRVAFELTAAQRRAVAAFAERLEGRR